MARKRVKRKVDRQVFSHTAIRGKKINVDPRITRGGIRL